MDFPAFSEYQDVFEDSENHLPVLEGAEDRAPWRSPDYTNIKRKCLSERVLNRCQLFVRAMNLILSMNLTSASGEEKANLFVKQDHHK